jgi:hypothetical protein
MAIDIFLMLVLFFVGLTVAILVPLLVRYALKKWQLSPKREKDVVMPFRYLLGGLAVFVVWQVIYFVATIVADWMTMTKMSPMEASFGFSFLAVLFYWLSDMMTQAGVDKTFDENV